MRTLSNNRNNAIGPWYVNSNNGPSNANGNNWGGRTPTQGGICFFPCPTLQRIVLNHAAETPQIFRAVGITAKEAEGGVLTINPEQERNTP